MVKLHEFVWQNVFYPYLQGKSSTFIDIIYIVYISIEIVTQLHKNALSSSD